MPILLYLLLKCTETCQQAFSVLLRESHFGESFTSCRSSGLKATGESFASPLPAPSMLASIPVCTGMVTACCSSTHDWKSSSSKGSETCTSSGPKDGVCVQSNLSCLALLATYSSNLRFQPIRGPIAALEARVLTLQLAKASFKKSKIFHVFP